MNTQQQQQQQQQPKSSTNTINFIQNNFYFNNNASPKMSSDDTKDNSTTNASKSSTTMNSNESESQKITTLDERKRTLTLQLDNRLIRNNFQTPNIACLTPQLNYSISVIETPSNDIKLPTPMIDSMITDLLNQHVKDQTSASTIPTASVVPPPQIPQIDPSSFTTLDNSSIFSVQDKIKDEPQIVPTHRPPAKRARRTSTKQSSSISSTSSSPTRSSSCDKTVTTANGDITDDKAELKRKRNREAARKCRTRKLEKIANLENEVQKLTNKNQAILDESDKISKEIEVLRAKLNEHRELHGCDLPSNL